MTYEGIRAAIEGFIELVDGPAGTDRSDAAVALVLDRLALSIHFAPDDIDERNVAWIEHEDWRARYAKVAAVFPDYGHFEVAFPFSCRPQDTELCTADAVDGMADVYGDLKEILGIWDAGDPDGALARFRDNTHWQEHLRELQHYLFARARESWGRGDETEG